MNKEIKQRAIDKAFAKIHFLKLENKTYKRDIKAGGTTDGRISLELLKNCLKSNERELLTWQYIAKLVETDEATAKAIKSKETVSDFLLARRDHAGESAKYIFLLDFNDGKAYRYDISSLCTDENKWNPDHESCEAFLHGAGHSVKDCEWMVTNNNKIEYGN